MSNIPGVADHGAPPPPFIARARKFVVATCGLGAELLAAGVLDGKAEAIVTGLLGVAAAYGVYRVPNAKS